MISFKGRTFCASPECKNACGRAMSKEDEQLYETLDFKPPIAFGFYCGQPTEKETP